MFDVTTFERCNMGAREFKNFEPSDTTIRHFAGDCVLSEYVESNSRSYTAAVRLHLAAITWDAETTTSRTSLPLKVFM